MLTAGGNDDFLLSFGNWRISGSKKKPSAAEDERQLSVQQTREGFLLKSASSLTAVSQRFIEVPCVSSEHQHE